MSDFPGGKGGGPTPFSNAFKPNSIASLQYNTSQAGSPIPIVYGCQRCAVNLLEFWGEHGFTHQNTKGGKGLGGSGGKKGSNASYSVNVAFGVCQGPANFVGAPNGFLDTDTGVRANRVWANGSVAGIDRTPVNLYGGLDGQAPDPVFESSDTNTPVLGYSGTCYVTGTPLQLGSTPALPNVQFEISGFLIGSGGPSYPGDASPGAIIIDMLTNPRYGAGFPLANLDVTGSIADFSNYCQAGQLALSMLMDRQQPAARWIEEICQLTVAAPVWSGSVLKIIPYGDTSLIGNGATWTPNLTWQYSFTDDDLLTGGSSDPVLLTRSDPSSVTNWLGIEYKDSSNNYNPQIIAVWDQGLIDQYGLRTESSIQAQSITNPLTATLSAQIQLQRKAYIRNTVKFKVGWRYSLLEPMDIILLSDTVLGLAGLAAAWRVTQIVEDDNGELTVTAEEIPGGTITSPPIGALMTNDTGNTMISDNATPIVFA